MRSASSLIFSLLFTASIHLALLAVPFMQSYKDNSRTSVSLKLVKVSKSYKLSQKEKQLSSQATTPPSIFSKLENKQMNTIDTNPIDKDSPIQAPQIIYPVLSRKKGEEGDCVLELYIAQSGSVVSVKMVKSTGYIRLDTEAIRAANELLYPTQENIESPKILRMKFQLL